MVKSFAHLLPVSYWMWQQCLRLKYFGSGNLWCFIGDVASIAYRNFSCLESGKGKVGICVRFYRYRFMAFIFSNIFLS